MKALSALFGKLKALLAGKQDILGVDIGSYAVKFVLLQNTGKSLKLKTWGYAPVNIKADAAPEERKFQSAQALRDLLSSKNIKTKLAATSVAGSSVIVRYVRLPKRTKEEMARTISADAEPFIPFDINEVSLGFHILGEVIDEGQRKNEVVLVASKKELVKEKMEMLSLAGLSPVVIDIDAFALGTLGDTFNLLPATGAALLLNIGHKLTNLSILEKGAIRVVRDIPVGGATLNKALHKKLRIEIEKCEAAKRGVSLLTLPSAPQSPAAPEILHEALSASEIFKQGDPAAEPAPPPAQKTREEAVAEILQEVMHDLVGEVRRSVDFYLSQGPNRTISKVYLCGGSANISDLAPFLTNELRAQVEILNPLGGIESAAGAVPAEILPSLSVAAGLACRKMWDWEK